MTERDELIELVWSGAVADRVKDGLDPEFVPVVRPKVEALADAILSAGYGKSSDRRPSIVTDAADRVAYFLNWHQGDNDIAADLPSGPSLYTSDLQVILNELKAGSAK